MTTQQLLPYFADCAARAETIRRAGTEAVFVMGCEVSMFAIGFLPGQTTLDRLANLSSGAGGVQATLEQVTAQLDDFLAEGARLVRERFGGKVTYAAGPWESIDWAPFDIVAVDAYRSAHNAASFRDEIRKCFKYGKPVAVTEFGTCAYVGAADRGGTAWAVLDQDAATPRLTERLVRDEREQARYLNDL